MNKLANSFRDGALKTNGTDIEKILPPLRRFRNGNRAEKKQKVIDKLSKFFEKYFGIIDINYEYKIDDEKYLLKVASPSTPYINDTGSTSHSI